LYTLSLSHKGAPCDRLQHTQTHSFPLEPVCSSGALRAHACVRSSGSRRMFCAEIDEGTLLNKNPLQVKENGLHEVFSGSSPVTDCGTGRDSSSSSFLRRQQHLMQARSRYDLAGVYISTSICIYVYVHVYIYTHVYMCVCVCVCVCVHTHTHTHCMYIRTCTYIYIYIYITS